MDISEDNKGFWWEINMLKCTYKDKQHKGNKSIASTDIPMR